MTAVCSQVPMKPAAWKFLKRAVAIKLMVGHMRQKVIEHRIKIIIKIGVLGISKIMLTASIFHFVSGSLLKLPVSRRLFQ